MLDKKYCAVIFDFDGTLYDNTSMIRDLIFALPLDSFKMLAERKTRRSMKGIYYGTSEKYLAEKWRGMCRKHHFKSEKAACDWYSNVFLKTMISLLKKKYTARPKAAEIFKKLRSDGIKSAVFSDYPFVKERMEALGLNTELADRIYDSEELGGLKPAKEVFEKIAGELVGACEGGTVSARGAGEVSAGGEPESGANGTGRGTARANDATTPAAKKILVVGDRNDTDGQGARNCGMDFIQIKTKNTRKNQSGLPHPLLAWEDFARLVLE